MSLVLSAWDELPIVSSISLDFPSGRGQPFNVSFLAMGFESWLHILLPSLRGREGGSVYGEHVCQHILFP